MFSQLLTLGGGATPGLLQTGHFIRFTAGKLQSPPMAPFVESGSPPILKIDVNTFIF